MANKLQIFAWSLYDLANTAFSALFITFFFPMLIKVYLGGNEFQIGLTMGISMLLAGIFVPIIGAISDATNKRMPFIITFTIVCVLFTAITGFVGLTAALIFGVLATLTFHSAIDVYDAKLVDISNKENMGRVSSYGVALGYLGTILSLVMAWLILNKFGWENEFSIKLMFPAIALFFLIFSLFPFFYLKDKKTKKVKHVVRKALSEIKSTFTSIKKYKGLLTFLIASFIYTDAVNTVIIFLFLFGQEQIGLTVQQFFPAFAAMALAASIGSLVFGKISDHIGAKKTLLISLGLWTLIIVYLMNITNIMYLFELSNTTAFIIAGSIGGAVLGAIWTVTRPMLVSLSPKHKIAELFGFQGLTEKFSGVLGPIVFGFVVAKTGNYDIALWILLGFFIIGFLLLLKVPEKR
jgi:MFS transporter, UMF1 family